MKKCQKVINGLLEKIENCDTMIVFYLKLRTMDVK